MAPGLQPDPLPVTVYLRVVHPEQGAGFEPAKACATGFADRPLRPLGNPRLHPPTISTPGGIRTPDHRIWSSVLYQLSYRRMSINVVQHARRESNPRLPGLESGALPAELQAYLRPGTSVRPEGFEPPASGFVIRRSAPAELRARASILPSTAHRLFQAPGGIRTLGLRTGGPALRPSELQVHFRSMRTRRATRPRFSCRCPEGIEPSASGVEVRRSWPAELQAHDDI
jgi:hypothetical protein